MGTINAFLDKSILPWPVRFLTHRFVIIITIMLLLPLIAFASNTVFVLTTNSYLKTMSVAVSSIVLLYARISETRDKQIAEMKKRMSGYVRHILGEHLAKTVAGRAGNEADGS